MPAFHLISTVGSSLRLNIERAGEDCGDLKDAYLQKDWTHAARLLNRRDMSDRTCGAEINSIHALSRAGHIARDAALYFLVSDTDDGSDIGEVLRSYYGLDSNRIRRIEGLDAGNPAKFRRDGLVNLVRTIADIVKGTGNAQDVALNPLGGYKAEIAVAGIIGVALSMPVYYMFEGAQPIKMPIMPIAFDDRVYDEVIPYLGKTVKLDPDERIDERIAGMVEVEPVDGARRASINFIGELFVQAYLHQHPQAETLPRNATQNEKKEPRFRDDHYPTGFPEYVRKVWADAPYIKHAYSLPYDGQAAIRHGRFCPRAEYGDEIVGEFKSNFGARYAITTTAATKHEISAVLKDLNAKFGGGWH